MDLGYQPVGATIRIPWNSFDAAGASVTASGFAAATIEVYKDGSATQRASDSGITATTDFDAATGCHLTAIDLSDNADAGFYVAGSEYLVMVNAVTIDGQTVRFWLARFRIGVEPANVTQISGDATAADNLESMLDGTGGAALTLSKLSIAATTGPAVDISTADVADFIAAITVAGGFSGIFVEAARAMVLSGPSASLEFEGPIRNTHGTPVQIAEIQVLDKDDDTPLYMLTDYIASLKAVSDKVDDTLEDDAGTFRFTTNALEQAPSGGLDAAGVRAAVGLAAANLDTQLSTIDTVVDGIAAKTTNLPSDPADQSLIIAATDAVMTRLGAPAGASVSADVAAVKAQTAAIEVDTQDLQARTPAALVSGRMDASVGAMAANVLTAAALAADAGAEIADAVWDEALAGHLGAGSTGAALNGAGAAGDPWTTPLPGAYGAGTAGNIIGTQIDAAVSTRLAAAGYTTPPTSAANATAVRAELTTELARIDAPTSTRATPAQVATELATYDAPTNAEMVARTLAAASYATAAGVSAVESDTQDLQARLPAALIGGRLDANVGAVNNTAVTGDGAAIPWGPA